MNCKCNQKRTKRKPKSRISRRGRRHWRNESLMRTATAIKNSIDCNSPALFDDNAHAPRPLIFTETRKDGTFHGDLHCTCVVNSCRDAIDGRSGITTLGGRWLGLLARRPVQPIIQTINGDLGFYYYLWFFFLFFFQNDPSWAGNRYGISKFRVSMEITTSLFSDLSECNFRATLFIFYVQQLYRHTVNSVLLQGRDQTANFRFVLPKLRTQSLILCLKCGRLFWLIPIPAGTARSLFLYVDSQSQESIV